MNTTQAPTKTVITLDMICQQKAEKLAEIRTSKQLIANRARELFHPAEEAMGSAKLLTSNLSSGVAIFNGVMTGFKIIKRIRNLFRRR